MSRSVSSVASPAVAATPRVRLIAARAGAAALIVAGIVLRVSTIFSAAGTLDADMAVIGLMARHFRMGEFYVFHWGQAYAGSHEAMLGAVAFTLAGSSAPVLQLVTVVLSGVVAVLIWLIGRETVGERVAWIAALLFWVWPAGFVWWAIKPGSDYWASLCFALAAVLVLLWLANGRRDGWPWFAVLGVLVGLSWWGNPQTVAVLAPAALWHVRFLLQRWRMLGVIGAGALVGVAPWLAYNLRNDWLSLHLPPPEAAYPTRLWRTLTTSGPMSLGLRVPFTREWLVPRVVYLAFFALLAIAVVRRRPRTEFLLFVLVAMPFLLVASPLSGYVDQPRYLLFTSPVVALLLARLLSAGPRWVSPLALVVALVLTVVAIDRMARPRVTAAYAPDVTVPRHVDDALDLLRDAGADAAFADYWLSYRLTFESDEELIVSPVYTIRHKPFDARVRAEASPPYVFIRESRTYEKFLEWCTQRGVVCKDTRKGDFALVQPAERLLPEEVPFHWQFPDHPNPGR